MTRLAIALLCTLAVAGPAQAQTRAAIQALNDEWDAAFDKGDAAALAAMYAEDAYVLPPGAEIVHGRKAIEAFWAKAVQELGEARLTTVDVLPLGADAAREIGTFSFKTKGASPRDVAGKYVVVWRKLGGRWLLATDIWNTGK
jgi:uncharacterized protein (TIGR02246 family)